MIRWWPFSFLQSTSTSIPPSVTDQPEQSLAGVVPTKPRRQQPVIYKGPQVIVGFVAAGEVSQQIDASLVHRSVQPGDMRQGDNALASDFRMVSHHRPSDLGQDRLRAVVVQRQGDHSHPNKRLSPIEGGINVVRPLDPSQR
ncbi:hypothetical protein ACIRP3_43670 [Streptomyces sp. NPDC101209]|uniref:hypothetical protein n=1 Tax=Streptomyces sp. NPDC101209 TaxID=3366129 RepID=UPI0038024359